MDRHELDSSFPLKALNCLRPILRILVNNSSPGQAVYDPFIGSGTTIIAAESTGRTCFGVEIDPLYVDVAIKRWQAFSGKTAELAGNGRTFEALANERLAEAGDGA